MVGENTPVCLDKKSDVFIEIGTPLQLSVEGVDAVFKSIFVGAKPDDYIVTSPLSQSHPVMETLTEKSKITARYIHQNHLLVFQTQFIKTISTPVPLMLWAFPSSVRNTQQRAQKRINCLLSGQIELNTPKKKAGITGVIKDISKSGCRFQLKRCEAQKELFQVGEEIIVRCCFPGISGEQQSVGSVVGVMESDDELTVRIKFSNILWWVPPYGV
ncbi:MAG: flagellar brake protein [Pseudomonadota bacterium]